MFKSMKGLDEYSLPKGCSGVIKLYRSWFEFRTERRQQTLDQSEQSICIDLFKSIKGLDDYTRGVPG